MSERIPSEFEGPSVEVEPKNSVPAENSSNGMEKTEISVSLSSADGVEMSENQDRVERIPEKRNSVASADPNDELLTELDGLIPENSEKIIPDVPTASSSASLHDEKHSTDSAKCEIMSTSDARNGEISPEKQSGGSESSPNSPRFGHETSPNLDKIARLYEKYSAQCAELEK